MSILALQALIVLFSSFAVGISLEVITTLMILIPQPVVTSFTILEIAGWLLTSGYNVYLKPLARSEI
jgi:hypothetical protein